MNDVKGFTIKTKSKIVYNSVKSVTAPVPYQQSDSDIKRGENTMEIEELETSSDTNENNSSSESEYAPDKKKSKIPSLVSQMELNDFVRDLGLPKDGSEFLASFLKKKNLLELKTKVSFYRNRDFEFRKYFVQDKKSSLVFCKDVEGLMNVFQPNSYKTSDWRLFIDSSKRSIKAVLLHNTNVYAPIPIAHSTVMNEKYKNMEILLQRIQYQKHLWQICGDLKIITLLLGQSGFTKYPCYLCLWDSRDRQNHYSSSKQWPVRSSFIPGSNNIINESLVDPSKILIPPLHKTWSYETICESSGQNRGNV